MTASLMPSASWKATHEVHVRARCPASWGPERGGSYYRRRAPRGPSPCVRVGEASTTADEAVATSAMVCARVTDPPRLRAVGHNTSTHERHGGARRERDSRSTN